MCEYAKNNFNVDCRNEKLEDANIMDSSFDAAALWHTLEHLEAPLQTLKLLSEKLKDNGFIFITVPNFESGNSKANGFAWKHLQPEAHLSHFTPDSLKNILLKAGFETLSLKKSGGTGLLGKESSVNSKIKDFIAANIGKFSFLRKIIKFFAVSLFGKDDFITVVGKKRRND
jgi:predicted SAM-dependent methyltransferase